MFLLLLFWPLFFFCLFLVLAFTLFAVWLWSCRAVRVVSGNISCVLLQQNYLQIHLSANPQRNAFRIELVCLSSLSAPSISLPPHHPLWLPTLAAQFESNLTISCEPSDNFNKFFSVIVCASTSTSSPVCLAFLPAFALYLLLSLSPLERLALTCSSIFWRCCC